MFKTKVTEKLGIKYPIIQGGMLWTSKADFVAAVSNAGGLGILTAPSFFTKEEFSQEVKKTKSLTDKPFGVNVPFLPGARELPLDGYIETVIEEGVKVVETIGAIDAALIERFHSAGATCIHKVTSVKYAISAVKRGVDMVAVEGTECAGHPGMDDISSLVLIRRAVEQLQVPVIAAGGFVDGKGLVAALALGAEAILMGSRFFMTKEGPAHPNIKEWCLNAQETDTAQSSSRRLTPSANRSPAGLQVTREQMCDRRAAGLARISAVPAPFPRSR